MLLTQQIFLEKKQNNQEHYIWQFLHKLKNSTNRT